MKKISIMTATRAEYGLLKPIILKLMEVPEFDVRVVVTGAHLSPEFGLTYKEIEQDGIDIDEKIDILLSSDNPSSISKSMGLAMLSFADYFDRLKPDMLVVLGDRYELLAVASVAMNQRIPIAHLHGGEAGSGTVDNMVRHAISKLSTLHFTSTWEYKNRVIQLGENPCNVHNVGAVGVENINNMVLLSKDSLEKILNFKINDKTVLVTFHPLSLHEDSARLQCSILLKALGKIEGLRIIFTKANADVGGRIINQMIDEFVSENKDIAIAYSSLGALKYLSTLKYVKAVIGNSSSGIIEAPSIGTYTLDIGERQKGRIHGNSVFHCNIDVDEITNKINDILSYNKQKKFENPYEKENTSNNIVRIIKDNLTTGLDINKNFFDLEANFDDYTKRF